MIRVFLNGIVKNEADRIERMLVSVAPHICGYVILDTGSSDDTQQRIRDFMGARGIPGQVAEGPFENFSVARNLALDYARRFHADLPWDYLLLCDADMEMQGQLGELTAPAYMLEQRSETYRYWNTRLLRRNAPASYVGVTHEYLSVEGVEHLHSAWFLDHADGANRPGKAARDAAMLRAAVEAEPDDARSWFYLAQSLRDMGELDEAAFAFRKRIALGGWLEEVWSSELALSRIQRAQKAPESTHATLEAWHKRPDRLEPLADLARYYRELGMNEVALMFAVRGLGIMDPTDDLLFVETQARDELRETFAICAYYSKDSETRKRGAEVCDAEALRRIPEGMADAQATHFRARRELARQNLFWYLRPITEYLPSWQAHQLNFVAPEHYVPMGSSIARVGDRLLAAQRAVNYVIDERGYVRISDGLPLSSGAEIHTRNFLIEFDPTTLEDKELYEIAPPPGFPEPAFRGVQGFEDARLFVWRGEPWVIATVREQSADGAAEQWIARLGEPAMIEARPIRPGGERRNEKNWIPLVDGEELKFVYLCDPTRILDPEGGTIKGTTPSIAAEHFSGGSQAIRFDEGWLAVVHIRIWVAGWPKYHHRFVWFNEALELAAWSRPFTFPAQAEWPILLGYQFALGLCWYPDERRLLLSYQVNESQSWLGVFTKEDISKFIGLTHPVKLQRSPSSSDDALWVLDETNHALQHRLGIEHATKMLVQLGLPQHETPAKNWDTYLALRHCLWHCAPNDHILDAGGTRGSAFLPALAQLGYRKLLCLNLVEPHPTHEGGISYSWGDITATELPGRTFRFVFCQSVLEHDVDWRAWLREAVRITQLGGLVFVSVDYWETPIETNVKIFEPEEIKALIAYAGKYGLQIKGEVDYRCRDKAVHWYGNEYTFLNLLFRRT